MSAESSNDTNTANEEPPAAAAINTRDPSGFLNIDEFGRPKSSVNGQSNGQGSGQSSSNGQEAPVVTVVKIIGTARDDLNGLLGFCTAYNRDRERYMVRMASVDPHNSPHATVMALKPTNLARASTMEGYKAQLQQLLTDPRVRQKMAYYYQYANEKYCKPFKLEHVVGFVTIGVGLLFYLLGGSFTKTLMLLSALIMVGMIAAEDVLPYVLTQGEGQQRTKKPFKEILKNFPSRSKVVMEKQFPFLRSNKYFTLTEPIAAGIVGVLLAVTIQSVFFTNTNNASSSSSTTNSPTSASSSMPWSGSPLTTTTDSAAATAAMNHQRELQLEKYYHLGFQDSIDGKDRGQSFEILLLEEQEAAAAARAAAAASISMDDDDLDLDDIQYSPTPNMGGAGVGAGAPPNKSFMSRLLSMRTAGSVFYLYRMAMQIGVDPSTGLFSIAQLAANIQHSTPATVPVWQKGMLAFSCYNLISNLFF